MRDIIAEELDRYRLERTAPRGRAARHRAARPRRGAPRRSSSSATAPSSAPLDPAAREAVDALTRGIVNKLLHEPTVRMKDAAGTARGELYADALAELFDLLDVADPDALMPAPARAWRRAAARWRAGRRSASPRCSAATSSW